MPDNCKRLPSYQSAVDFVDSPNVENSIRVIGSWLGRSLIVAAGMAISGQNFESSIKNGLIAATAIEVFVLGHAIHDVRSAGKEQGDE